MGRGRRGRRAAAPGAGRHRLPAGGPPAEGQFRRRQPACRRVAGRGVTADGRRRRIRGPGRQGRAPGRFSSPQRRQRRCGARRRLRQRHLSQGPVAELRCVRRGPLLRSRRSSRKGVGHRRDSRRHLDLRGHLVPWRAAWQAGRCRSGHLAQHQRFPLPPRQGRRARCVARGRGGAFRSGDRVSQHGRGPG